MNRKWKHASTDPRYAGTYQSWADMRKRCNNPKHPHWAAYGGRGIKVCERWQKSFDIFISDMGIRPDGLTIERIDVNQGYDPFNCIWATWEDQWNNVRANPIHGSVGMYHKHKCRCGPCVEAFRIRRRRQAKNQTLEAREKKLKYIREYHRRKRNQT